MRSPTARSRSEMASLAASTSTSCRRLRKARNRNGQKGTVPTRGRPGRDLKDQIETTREKREAPSPPFFRFGRAQIFSRNCHRAPLGAPARGEDEMFARTPRLLLRPGFPEDAPALAAAIADEAIARNLANVPWPYRMRDAEAFLASPRDPVLPSLLIFERTARRAAADRRLRARPAALGRGRDGLLDRPRRIGAAALRPRPASRWSTSPGCSASPASKARTSSTIPLRRGCSKSSASSRRGLVAPRMSCARGEEVPARLMRLELQRSSTRRRGAGGLEALPCVSVGRSSAASCKITPSVWRLPERSSLTPWRIATR